MDELWSEGWRHFGSYFFRYNIGIHDHEIRRVVPLRISLEELSLSKSHRRNLARNRDLLCSVKPFELTDESVELFHRHKTRFRENVPPSIFEFLPEHADAAPCEIMEVNVRDAAKLLAVSYFSVGHKANSGIYAMFEPTELRRGLGIFTLLKELEFAKETGRTVYYLGYSYEGRSFYDYKKQFRGTEAYDWTVGWHPFSYRDESIALGVKRTEKIITDA
ncbi:MAG: arginine-tRNA-protein transferase [Acidobacteria bacterium]|nr:arginine-tRNA-protein transferase [Acidobacteriota bacterium]